MLRHTPFAYEAGSAVSTLGQADDDPEEQRDHEHHAQEEERSFGDDGADPAPQAGQSPRYGGWDEGRELHLFLRTRGRRKVPVSSGPTK